jgi:hypothetical protein
MAAGVLNLLIEQGSTFLYSLSLRDANGPMNLTNFTARMQIRRTVGAPAVLLELTTANGRIAISGGTVALSVDAADTALLDFSKAVYDLEIESPNGDVTRLIQGDVVLSKEVTR